MRQAFVPRSSAPPGVLPAVLSLAVCATSPRSPHSFQLMQADSARVDISHGISNVWRTINHIVDGFFALLPKLVLALLLLALVWVVVGVEEPGRHLGARLVVGLHRGRVEGVEPEQRHLPTHGLALRGLHLRSNPDRPAIDRQAAGDQSRHSSHTVAALAASAGPPATPSPRTPSRYS